MNFFQAYKTDATDELEGRWFSLRYGGRVKLARVGNKKYKELGRKLEERARERNGAEVLDDDEAVGIICEALAGAVLLDWDLEGEDGKPLEYSTEKAAEILREFEDFRVEVIEKASAMENFRVKRVKAEAKNSAARSNGK